MSDHTKQLLLGLLSAAILGGALYAMLNVVPLLLRDLGTPAHLERPIKASAFSLRDADGQDFTLDGERGKIVVLLFWTSWNEVALEAVHRMNEYRSSLSPEVTVLAVNSQESPEDMSSIFKNSAIPVVFDENGAVGEAYAIGVLPLTVVIDRSGFVAARHIGLLELSDLEALLRPLAGNSENGAAIFSEP